MGLLPERTAHIAAAAKFMANFSTELIDYLAEAPRPLGRPFDMVPAFHYLYTDPE